VDAAKITSVLPVEDHGVLQPLDAGISLRLDDGSTFRTDARMGTFAIDTLPNVGDVLIRDKALELNFIISPEKFETFFKEQEKGK
jgi:hypothetical protein